MFEVRAYKATRYRRGVDHLMHAEWRGSQRCDKSPCTAARLNYVSFTDKSGTCTTHLKSITENICFSTKMDVGILLVFAVVFLCSYYFIIRQKNLPPGPFCFPIIGSVQLIRRFRQTRPYIALTELSEKYGPVLSFKLGTARFVVLSGYDAIHEALVKRSDSLMTVREVLCLKNCLQGDPVRVFYHFLFL